jgi:hypothetical protein
MKLFETPVIETAVFTTEDVITASSPSVDNDGFNDEVVMP